MAAFTGFLFLSLCPNAKFKVFANRHTSHWKLILFYAPVLTATIISASKVIDYFQSPAEQSAFSAYRMVYASVWYISFPPLAFLKPTTNSPRDFRFNVTAPTSPHLRLSPSLYPSPKNPAS